MANLKVYIDRGPRSELATQQLTRLGIDFDIENVHQNEIAAAFLLNQNRPPSRFPLPQYYVNGKLAWESFKEVSNLTADQINERIGELNA